MKKIALILFLLCNGLGVSSVFAQRYKVAKVCYGSGRSAMVVEYDQQYYIVTSNSVMFTTDMLITDISSIYIGGQSEMWFARTGSERWDYVNVIPPGGFVFVNNRWQRFMYSGLPGAKSVCRQIARGY